MNHGSNLVGLCYRCHDQVHNNKIVINGWRSTSKGRILDWRKVKKKVMTKDQRAFILNYKGKINQKEVVMLFRKTYSLKVSLVTVLRVWSSTD